MKTIKINGKVYTAKEFDFNMVCDLQDMGIELGGNTKQIPLIRAYVATCMGVDKETAGKELEKHIIAVGNANKAFEEIATVMSEMLEQSDFFRTLSQTEEKEVAEKKTSKSQKN